jgi:hypothetical protein
MKEIPNKAKDVLDEKRGKVFRVLGDPEIVSRGTGRGKARALLADNQSL